MCPGGWLRTSGHGQRGEGVAGRLRLEGVATFILKYRLREYGHPAPLQDVLRAVRLLRSRREQFGIRTRSHRCHGRVRRRPRRRRPPRRCSTPPEGRTGAALDRTERDGPTSSSLLYPVITMAAAVAHMPIRARICSAQPDRRRRSIASWSLETQVATGHAAGVHRPHRRRQERAAREQRALLPGAASPGVPAELHLYQRGPHGFGTRTDLGTTSGWVDRWIEWMRLSGFSPRPDQDKP